MEAPYNSCRKSISLGRVRNKGVAAVAWPESGGWAHNLQSRYDDQADTSESGLLSLFGVREILIFFSPIFLSVRGKKMEEKNIVIRWRGS
jgi:hypothetical protein